MTEILYKTQKDIGQPALLNLYNDAGWSAYTLNPEQLTQSIRQSLFVYTAWENEQLVGLIRVVGDGLTIIYVQDVLVLKSHKRRGIGRKLIEKILEEYKSVRQKVLLTDDTPETRGFYESLGFRSCDNGQLVAFIHAPTPTP